MRLTQAEAAMGKFLRWLYNPEGPPLRSGDFAKAAIFVLTVGRALAYAIQELGAEIAWQLFRAFGIVDVQSIRGAGTIWGGVLGLFMLAAYYVPYLLIVFRRLLCVTGRRIPSFLGVFVALGFTINLDFDFHGYLVEAALLLLLLPWKERWHAPEERTPEAAPGPAAPDGKAR